MKSKYAEQLNDITEKFLNSSSSASGTRKLPKKIVTKEELEKKAREVRQTYSDMPDYCVYPDCFHCPYGECGWDKAGNEEALQDIIRGFSRL